MAIRAVGPIGLNSNKKLNSVSFKGRENKNSEINPLRNTMVAIPLATLLAMCSMNTASAGRNDNIFGEDTNNIEMVEQAKPEEKITITKSKDGHGVLVQITDKNKDHFGLVFNSQNADGKYQSLTIDMPSNPELNEKTGLRETVTRTVQGLRPLKYVVAGDDGASDINFTFRQVVTNESPVGYSSSTVTKFLEDFAAGKIQGMKNDGAVKMLEPMEYKVSVDGSGNLVHGPIKTGWLDEGRANGEYFGRPIMSADVQTDHGKYSVIAVSDDNNDKNFESVVIKKEGEGQFKIAGLNYSHIKIADRGNIGDFNMGIIELYKRNSQQKVQITDQKLFQALWDLTKDSRFNNAYPTKMVEANLKVVARGMMAPQR